MTWRNHFDYIYCSTNAHSHWGAEETFKKSLSCTLYSFLLYLHSTEIAQYHKFIGAQRRSVDVNIK